MIKIERLSGGYGSTFSLKNIHLQVNKGEFFGIIGPNGSGKTTLVKMLSGIIRPQTGSISIDNWPLAQYRSKDLAKKLAVLPQLTEQAFRFTVHETVALGRYAHQSSLFNMLTEYDEQVINEAMELTDVKRYEQVTIDQLSGGERQRVYLAQALAQEPEIILLDEPTNHLDLTYQKELLDLLNLWIKERGLTVVAIFHDLNLASLFCDRLLLMNKGEVFACGKPNEVLSRKNILKVYETKIENRSHPEIPKLQVMLTPKRMDKKIPSIHEKYLFIRDDFIIYKSPEALKTLSTSTFAEGIGWYKNFINRYIEKSHSADYSLEETTKQLLIKEGIEATDSITTLTSTKLKQHAIKKIVTEYFSLLIVVTASATHAIDISRATDHLQLAKGGVGTINTWVFVDGKLTDTSFIQAIVTATEAKVKALHTLKIKDQVTETLATGNATDNIVLATSQRGARFNEANSASMLGAHIGEAVYECILEAINKSS